MTDRDPAVYAILMAVCLGLILLAWNVVRLWSTAAAVVMSVVAAVIPPVAVIVAIAVVVADPKRRTRSIACGYLLGVTSPAGAHWAAVPRPIRHPERW